jgi:glycosyltransferase involved in cell wall biosynthesis
MAELPRITVVMPSFNQGMFLEAAICSVLDQKYAKLEYFVLDGGSTDGSVAIIERYAEHLTYWHSRSDAGQADALRTGFSMATGDIFCWLNSDDIFLPGALETVGGFFARHRKVDVLYGNRVVIDRDGNVIGRHIWPWILTRAHWATGQPLAQECTFWRRAIYDAAGGIDPSKFFIMDYDLFFRMWRIGRFRKTPRFLGGFRVHEEAKNARYVDVWKRELAEAKSKYGLRDPGYVAARLVNRADRVQTWIEQRLWPSRDQVRQ